ncbi:MAG TPA: DUF3097 family protein [Acidimicrobiales bacterium]|nr:DUF3097 family protein [Acidimicrobiales bacterium]
MERSPRPSLGHGILSGPIDGHDRLRVEWPHVEARRDLVVMHRATGVRGKVVRVEKDGVVVRTALGTERIFRLAPGAFSVDGETVTLVAPRAPAASSTRRARTASGSVPVRAAARVARASRIFVEGRHDAELVERVWGDDLRLQGIVVEILEGIDHLDDVVRGFAPGPRRRMGVLVDHLVPGSKEARIAAAVDHPAVLITGTPFVDVWQAVRPSVVGITAWPHIPKGQPWKEGVCAALGVDDPGRLWRRILGSVATFADLEAPFVGAVERLIDFLTEGVDPGDD